MALLHDPPHPRWRVVATALALAGALALVGCGKKQEAQAVVGQVIAHVGPDDVTQPELDNELRLANIPADKRSDAVVKAVLSRIIERKYLAQQSVAAKLDREPTQHLDLLRSREQILAGAYVQRDLGAKVSAISNSEIDAFIQAHPNQFAKRQLFQIEQVSFPPQKDMQALADATKNLKSMDQVEAKLNELGIKYSRGPATLDSAAIPAEMLKPLAAKPDDIFFVRSRSSASFFKVTSVDEKPLTGDAANQFAERQIASELAKKTEQDTSNAAIAGAKFEGDYQRIMTAPASTGGEAAADAQSAEKPAGEEQKGAPKN